MSKRDYYEVLGVGRDADLQEIKSAYRKMALQVSSRPQSRQSQQAEEHFKEAAEAYSVLGDSEKRGSLRPFRPPGALQRLRRAAAVSIRPLSRISATSSATSSASATCSAAAAAQRTRVQRGEDLRYDLEIGFEDAVRGMSAEILIPRDETCPRCQGTPRRTGLRPDDLLDLPRPRRGHLPAELPVDPPNLSASAGAAARSSASPARSAAARARVRAERRLKINVPPGVDNGTRLRLSQEGQPGYNGGPPGDLYVVLKVKEHPVFIRDGSDLHCTVPINIAQAALGAEIQIPTLDEPETLNDPGRHAARRAVPLARPGRAARERQRARRPLRPRRGEGPPQADQRAAQAAGEPRRDACPPTTGPTRRASSTRSRITSSRPGRVK